ncbi:glycerophosphodiester phosphodiesterase [Hymenobacter terricola]|uniref:glycerophosphodiester phosphodiesterase n=1 Tax=Hymenobacter terricola TaxID=2819236 RepID=UPI001B308B6D|nr:glycerophosphodiester phosphodiesterase family protein [Hymenobacter terricola]
MRKYSAFTGAVLALFVLWQLAGCTASRPVPAAGPVALGHAGSGFFTPISPFNFRPPSSWRGVRHALRLGADGIEIDLQLSQDSVVMLYHDQTLENSSTGRGCISQYPAAALVQLRYRGGWPYDLFQKERPVTFDTVLARLSRRPTFPRLHLDLHEDDQCLPAGHQHVRTPALIRQIARSLARYQVPPARVLLITQEAGTLQLVRTAMPQVPIGLEIASDEFAPGLRLAKTENIRTVVLDADRVTPAQAGQAHAAGMAVVVFGGRSAKDIRRILAAQPDELEVDNIKRLLILLGRRK